MIDKSSIKQIIGSLLKHPQYLSEVDKYSLTPQDFGDKFDQYIFTSICRLYAGGARKIKPIDIENDLEINPTGKLLFEQNNGIVYLQDAEELSEPENFDIYYNKLKKINLLNALNKIGIDTEDIFGQDLTDPNTYKTREKFNDLTIKDIIDNVKKKLTVVEKEYAQGESVKSQNSFTGIRELLKEKEGGIDIGPPLQGDYFNQVLSGAKKGNYVVRSAGSGTGKTRRSVGDACYLAFPIRYDPTQGKWIITKNCYKTLFIATEQTIEEIQSMIIAYLTGFNESKFKHNNFTREEREIVEQALQVWEKYQDNLYIAQVPNPTIELIKSVVREHCLLYNLEYVFYDYIFIGPSLLNEFKGFNLRNDEVLLMFSTALKDLAVELNIFIMSSTQVNSNADKTEDLRNESTIAGSRSIINKADVGCVMARPSKQEIDNLRELNILGEEFPNIVTDIYKVRGGEWNQVRIWSYVDLGTLRTKDLFITDSRYDEVTNKFIENSYVIDPVWDFEEYGELLQYVDKLNKHD